MDNDEIIYLKNVCAIKDDFINKKISKKEYEQKLEIERQKYIEFLQNNNRILMEDLQRKYDYDELIKMLNYKEPIGYQGLTLEQRINEFLKKC